MLTNDARNTRRRQQRTIQQTQQLQRNITLHLTKYINKDNITFCEAPPILGGDIFPYNRATFHFCHQWGVRFGPNLVGEDHLRRDGFHVMDVYRHLLVKTVAAAALGINPHAQYRLARPPYGVFGPWMAPVGQGMAPRMPFRNADWPPLARNVASAPPFFFRQTGLSRSPMDTNIQRLR